MWMDPTSSLARVALILGRVPLPSGDFAIPLVKRSPGGRVREFTGQFAVVSPEDEHLGDFRWTIDAQGYVRRYVNARSRRMAREILNLGPGVRRDSGATLVSDHVNGDLLDNRRENLRACTQAQNCQNVHYGRGRSQHRGVWFDRINGGPHPWVAEGKKDRKKHYIGRFATELEAATAAVTWRREHLPYTTN